MSDHFLPSRDLPFLAKLGTAGVMISDDLSSQDEVREHLNRLSVSSVPGSLRSLLGHGWLHASASHTNAHTDKTQAKKNKKSADSRFKSVASNSLADNSQK